MKRELIDIHGYNITDQLPDNQAGDQYILLSGYTSSIPNFKPIATGIFNGYKGQVVFKTLKTIKPFFSHDYQI